MGEPLIPAAVSKRQGERAQAIGEDLAAGFESMLDEFIETRLKPVQEFLGPRHADQAGILRKLAARWHACADALEATADAVERPR